MVLTLSLMIPYSVKSFLHTFQIGKGQFSVVYRASCKVDGKIVALKKVQIFEMMDAKSRLDCMKEIQLLQVCAITQCTEKKVIKIASLS